MRTNTGQVLYIPRIGQRADFQHPLMKGCVGWWPLNDGAGTKAVDLSGNGNDGTQSGGVSWASTEKGTAASFDGVDDYFAEDTSTPAAINSNGFPHSISAWIYLDNASAINFGAALGNASTTNTLCCVQLFSSGVARYLYRSGSTIIIVASTSTTTAGAWYHVVGVSESTTSHKIYLNGVLEATDTTSVTASNNFTNFSIGALRRSTVDYGEGKVQNVRVYSRALSASEILELYTNPWAGLSIPSATRYFFFSSPSPIINPFSKIITSSTILNTSGKTVIRRGA